MTDQLEARLRGMLRDIDDGPMRSAILEADEIAEIADALARLRERERRLEGALREIIAFAPAREPEYEDWGGDTEAAEHWGLSVGLWDAATTARAALADTAAPAAEREG